MIANTDRHSEPRRLSSILEKCWPLEAFWLTRLLTGLVGGKGAPPFLLPLFASYQGRLLCRIVVQIRPQPALHFFAAHALPHLVVGNLVAVDLAQAEVPRLRVRKVEAAHA